MVFTHQYQHSNNTNQQIRNCIPDLLVRVYNAKRKRLFSLNGSVIFNKYKKKNTNYLTNTSNLENCNILKSKEKRFIK